MTMQVGLQGMRFATDGKLPNVNLQEGRLSSTEPFPMKENFSSQPALQATVDSSNSPAGPKSM